MYTVVVSSILEWVGLAEETRKIKEHSNFIALNRSMPFFLFLKEERKKHNSLLCELRIEWNQKRNMICGWFIFFHLLLFDSHN